MTKEHHKGLKTRLLDVVFGARNPADTSEIIAASRLPRRVQNIIAILYLATFLVFAAGCLGRLGWLNFLPTGLKAWWPWTFLPIGLVALAQDQISKHYARRARAAGGTSR